MTTTTPRDPLLEEREKTHGSFCNNAHISQSLKTALGHHHQTSVLSPVHQESLDMICLKLSRIVSGKAEYRDHWDDIAGYARLAAEECTK